MKGFLLLLAVTGALCVSMTATSTVVASAQTATGTVTVVHGLRGVVADVYVDGELALPAFQPERVTDPIQIPAGPHHVDIRLAGAPASDPPAVSADVDVIADARQSIVAHLDAAGNPTITAYNDDMTAIPAGQTRAVIRHTAAASPVDVALDDTVVATALAEPGSAQATVAPATYQVAVWSPGTREAVAAPQSASLTEGASTVMYLIGSSRAGTLSWIAEQIPDLATPPTQIQTGDSGLAATPSGDGRSYFIVVVVAIAGAVLGATLAVGAKRRSRLA